MAMGETISRIIGSNINMEKLPLVSLPRGWQTRMALSSNPVVILPEVEEVISIRVFLLEWVSGVILGMEE
jgi:hypothetical protein